MIKEHSTEKQPVKSKSKLKDFFLVNEVFGYFFRRKDPSRPINFNIKMMHGINKISIIIFLIGIIYIVLKHIL